uniref:Uncharacterized protein n=1 Tax=Knipowitschia caucasica TaxID=637954 RepID=A0AAV2KBE5_KNICA
MSPIVGTAQHETKDADMEPRAEAPERKHNGLSSMKKAAAGASYTSSSEQVKTLFSLESGQNSVDPWRRVRREGAFPS